MRVINLDDIGIKLITDSKKQIYLSLDEVKDFVNKKYSIENNVFTLNNKKLTLSDKDLYEFPNIVMYIENNFGNWLCLNAIKTINILK